MNCGSGYTLLEVLVVLLIVGVLAAMAAPGFLDAVRRNAMESTMLDQMSAIGLARNEAVSQGRVVTICRSTNQSQCAAANGADWDDGWIIFSDAGTAGTVDGSDALVEVQGAGNEQSQITLKTFANGNFTGDFLRFDDDGFLDNSTSGAYFKFCDQANTQVSARAIWITNTGRSALSTEQPDGIHHDLAGADLTCP